jgi:hypothetical protein
MANWGGMSRSNYFRVKDEAAFRAWAEDLELVVVADAQGRLGFYSNADDGGFPSWRYKEDQEEEQAVDLVAELGEHLEDTEVAVLMSAGHEKARYVSGYAVALNSEGKHVSFSLFDIYEKAAEIFRVDVSSISAAQS